MDFLRCSGWAGRRGCGLPGGGGAPVSGVIGGWMKLTSGPLSLLAASLPFDQTYVAQIDEGNSGRGIFAKETLKLFVHFLKTNYLYISILFQFSPFRSAKSPKALHPQKTYLMKEKEELCLLSQGTS